MGISESRQHRKHRLNHILGGLKLNYNVDLLRNKLKISSLVKSSKRGVSGILKDSALNEHLLNTDYIKYSMILEAAELLKSFNRNDIIIDNGTVYLKENYSIYKSFENGETPMNFNDHPFAKLLETQIEEAEVILAARKLVDDLQSIVSDISKMQVDELAPIVERIKSEIGVEEAESFQQSVTQFLQDALQAVQAAKNSLDTEALKLSGDLPANATDDYDGTGEDELGLEPEMDGEMDGEMDMEPDRELSKPMGREKKESWNFEKGKGKKDMKNDKKDDKKDDKKGKKSSGKKTWNFDKKKKDESGDWLEHKQKEAKKKKAKKKSKKNESTVMTTANSKDKMNSEFETFRKFKGRSKSPMGALVTLKVETRSGRKGIKRFDTLKEANVWINKHGSILREIKRVK